MRAARLEDAPAIALLHVEVWRRTYRDLAPADAIRALGYDRRLARWREILADPGPCAIALVATDDRDGAILGFVQGGPPGDPAFGAPDRQDCGEIKYLYVDTAKARRGIGRALLRAAAAMLRDRGYRSLALGVVQGNEPALAFYRAQGGAIVGDYIDPGPLWRSHNLVCAWDDIATIAGG